MSHTRVAKGGCVGGAQYAPAATSLQRNGPLATMRLKMASSRGDHAPVTVGVRPLMLFLGRYPTCLNQHPCRCAGLTRLRGGEPLRAPAVLSRAWCGTMPERHTTPRWVQPGARAGPLTRAANSKQVCIALSGSAQRVGWLPHKLRVAERNGSERRPRLHRTKVPRGDRLAPEEIKDISETYAGKYGAAGAQCDQQRPFKAKLWQRRSAVAARAAGRPKEPEPLHKITRVLNPKTAAKTNVKAGVRAHDPSK